MDWTNYLNNKYFEIIEKNAIKTTENKEKTKHDKLKELGIIEENGNKCYKFLYKKT